MISRQEIQRLIDRPAKDAEILSAFLDMSVNSDNKRTHQVFLNQEKAAFQELDSDRDSHHREAVGRAFARIEEWVEANYDEAKKGVALYMEVEGDWIEGHQLSVPLENRLVFDQRPVVGPLVEIVERYHHHGVILVDREHLRLMSIFLDQTLFEREVETEPYPTSHDVRRGGFSAKDFQARKAEETRHFFKEFADEVSAFVRRYHPDDLILLGTTENVKKFQEFLPGSIRSRIVHTDRMDIDASSAEVRRKLAPAMEARLREEEARAIDLLQDRVREAHLAVAGMSETLEQLQEGKLEALVIARGLRRSGGRCTACGFLLPDTATACPYCGGAVRDGIDLGEEMVRIAEDQGIGIDFVESTAVDSLGGVGGLLRF
jgi:peptide subunit release factor 1 (eRF1)